MELIPSGSTLINLACTNDPSGFAQPGWMINLVGDSNTAKSFLARTILAECAYKFGDSHIYDHDDIEHGVFWDDAKMFGPRFATMLEPSYDYKGEKTVENWYQHFCELYDKSKKEKRPFISAVDSWDALRPMADYAYLKALEAGKDKKTMGMAKAKLGSAILMDVVERLEETQSNLIVISQAKPNTDPMSFNPRTRSGGVSLRFYSSLELWLTNCGNLKLDKDTPTYGHLVKMKQTRSRLYGAPREIVFPITYVYGIDALQADIDYLVEHKVIKEDKRSLVSEELGITATPRKYAAEVEAAGKVQLVRDMVTRQWQSVELSMSDRILQGRLPKYGN